MNAPYQHDDFTHALETLAAWVLALLWIAVAYSLTFSGDGATEAWAFGRLPLAFSARCFTARHHHLNKDDCGFRCLEDPDGLLLAIGGVLFVAGVLRRAAVR